VIPDAPWRVVLVSQIATVAQSHAKLVRSLGHDPVAHLAARLPPSRDSPRGREFAAKLLMEAPQDLDLVYPAGRDRIESLLRFYEPDVLLCLGFPWRLPADALAVPRVACVNGHPSMLPRYRGPTPMGWAVRRGDKEIGMTYHVMDETFDTGGILAQKAVPLDDDETLESLAPKLDAAAGELLPVVFERLARGDRGDPQEGGDYESLFEEEYVYVDGSQSVDEVHTRVRAWRLTPVARGERGAILEQDGRRRRVVRTSRAQVDGAQRLECADGPIWIVESEPVE
jgi:methionyl-tRNA formyltransferase